MAKFRIYQIAKEFQLESKEVIELLKEIGVDVKSASSTINEEELILIKEKIEEYKKRGKKPSRPEPAKVEKKIERKEPEKKEKARKEEKPKRVEKKPAPAPRTPQPRKPEKPRAKEPVKKPEKPQRPAGKPGKGPEKKPASKRFLVIKKKKEIKFPKEVEIVEGETLKEIAQKLGIKISQIEEKLREGGLLIHTNDRLDSTLAHELGRVLKISIKFKSFEESLEELHGEGKEYVERAPIVTVMGHVDHGKTTLLDYIRKTKVAEREAGGITQHIGAYKVKVGDKYITFVDTPGHEAFTKLRARGAQVTDIVILVVAADDGVMPQTVEAINHAKAAGVPIIVAINKIDKPEADPMRVKQQLAEKGLLVEEWGGDTVAVEISAKTGKGVDELLEMITLMGELLELKAPVDVPAQGTILISRLDPRKGPVVTAIIQKGTLRVRDSFVAGTTWGRVRGLFDEFGKPVKEAGPSDPIEIMGFEEVPLEGERLFVVKDLERAKSIVELRKDILQEKSRKFERKITLEDLFKELEGEGEKELRLIIKADVIGSLEALKDSVERLSSDEVKIRILHAGTGPVTESDVLLASASHAVIIGFNVKAEKKAMDAALSEKVQIRIYRVIYELLNDLKKALQGMLEPKFEETVIGKAEIKQTFRIAGVGVVAGCMVIEGKVRRDLRARVRRGNEIIFDGKIASLKHYKDDVEEVRMGSECGIRLESFNDVQKGDIIEVYERRQV